MRSHVSPAVAAALARRAAIEPDVEVRSQLACSAKRLPARDALPIVRALLARSEDADDIHLPLLLWWALEAKVATDPEAVLALFEDRAIWDLPIVRATIMERLMRRFAAAGTRQDLTDCARLLALAPGPDHVKRLMAGFEAAYAGRSLAGLPPELADALAQYSGQSITLGLRQGKPEAIAEALRVLADERADRAKQLQLLQILGEVRRPACVPVVLRLACQSPDNALRSAALTALAGYDDPAIADRSDQGLCQHVRRRAGRRPELARDSARLGGPVPRGDRGRHDRSRTASRARSSRSCCCWATRESARSATRLFGPIKPATSAELHARIDRLAAVIRAGSGVPKPGKQIFDQQCARCHTLFGKGGKVGPDLTTYRRDDLETMLLNIVNPSAEIREGYSTHIVAMTDGRVLSGVVVEQDKNVVVLRGGDGKDVALARAEIDAMQAQPELDHARRSAQGPERPAGPRPVRLPAEHTAADRLMYDEVSRAGTEQNTHRDLQPAAGFGDRPGARGRPTHGQPA